MEYSVAESNRIGREYVARFPPVPEGIGRVTSTRGLRDRVDEALEKALETGVPVDWSTFDLSWPESSEQPASEAA